MINNSKIVKFRNFINENSDYLIKTEIGKKKNRWNVICSAMDWIDVSTSRISNVNFNANNIKDINLFSTEVFFYISMIDIIFESIKQLHRVIIDINSVPFFNEKSCFSNHNYSNDNDYFKHIRAIFGAHPVNLRDKENEKWFASWPVLDQSVNKKYDLMVYLYPLDSEKEMKKFGIKLVELNCFLEKRYNYLDELKGKLEKSIADYIEFNQDGIKYTGDIVPDLKLAKKRLSEVLPNEYFNYLIENGIKFIESYNKILYRDSIIDMFMNEIRLACENLKQAVQKLDFNNEENYKVFEIKSDNVNYTSKKYIAALENNRITDLFFYESAKKDLKKYNIEINKKMSNEEQLLIIYAYLYNQSKSVDNSKTYL